MIILGKMRDAPSALAASAEIKQRAFEAHGNLAPTSKTWFNAQAFANMNNGYLANYGIYAVVTGISVNTGAHTVQVQVSANLARLFPSVVPNVLVTETGQAQIRAFTK
jgi:hypothetical protein